ncbi:MAG: Na/Pi cotransporter family protein [Flavipsychrobacter sp.]|jgi:phosphate:Na+ symporter|nr:Na/Pi cotransporter family protein [Flavipsychrobacter sp.]
MVHFFTYFPAFIPLQGMGDGLSDIGRVLTGIAFFILGMSFLGDALEKLAGRPFKLFLKKHTASRIKAISAGAIVTGVLQSSSIVALIVLAFVGTGVLTMQNALAVALGANLGSTFANWIIATAGFELDIESFAYPIAGLTGIAMAFFKEESKWRIWCRFLLGFSLLFIGLDFMKSGIEEAVKTVDLSTFSKYPSVVFLLLGLVMTALVQSSSATVAIVLSALYANAINLYAATAIVLGSEIGTGIKLLLASAGGLAGEKRVAWGNIIFNVVTSLIVLVLLMPVNELITEVFGIKNNLIALVLFQTITNVFGIILFYPLLNILGRFLEKRFAEDDLDTFFIEKTGTQDTKIALEAFKHETLSFIHSVTGFCLETFDIKTTKWKEKQHKEYAKKPLMEKYEYLKKVHGDILRYYVQLQKNIKSEEDAKMADNLVSAVRNCMYTAKSIKDAHYDSVQLRNSSNDIKYGFFLHTKKMINDFFTEVLDILDAKHKSQYGSRVIKLYKSVQEGYAESLNEMYKEAHPKYLSDTEISTILNFNRELYSAFKAMSFALKDHLLDEKEAAYFEELPGFIR